MTGGFGSDGSDTFGGAGSVTFGATGNEIVGSLGNEIFGGAGRFSLGGAETFVLGAGVDGVASAVFVAVGAGATFSATVGALPVSPVTVSLVPFTSDAAAALVAAKAAAPCSGVDATTNVNTTEVETDVDPEARVDRVDQVVQPPPRTERPLSQAR